MNHRSPEPGSVLTDRIIHFAIKVHRKFGPGLYESIYQDCLVWELRRDGMNVRTEVPLPVIYEDMRFDKGYRADLIVDGTVLLELKSVETILRVHKAQLLTYLHLSRCTVGLLMNFNSAMLKDGLHRFIARSRVQHEYRD